MVSRTLTIALAVALVLIPALGMFSPSASAADIVYVITHEEADVYIDKDGSADIQYKLHITVRPQSITVDSIKVHLPNWRFDENDVSAALDGSQVIGLSKAGRSEDLLEISFNSVEAMEPGTDHVLIVVANVEAMVLKHPSKDDLARLTFTPTWWDKKEVQEVQMLTVRIHMPEDYLDDGNMDYTDGGTVTELNERLIISWVEEDLAASAKMEFRVDFPAEAVDQLYRPFWDIRFHFIKGYIIVLIIIVVVAIAAVGVKRALRRPYIKPFLRVEAWGPRKGLGPVEAALVLKRKRSLIVCMFLMDLVSVGAVEVVDPKTMEVKVMNPDYEGRAGPFLRCIREGRIDPIATTNLVASLEEEVNAKLEGHDKDETLVHYKAQGPKRWGKVRKTRPPSIDEALWLMTDPNAKQRFKDANLEGLPEWTRWKVRL